MSPETKRTGGKPVRGNLRVAGGQLAYETAGQGTAVLFIHSAIADGRLWDREIPLYSADHQAIRFDLRGYGGSSPASAPFSYVEDIHSLLAHLGVRRAFLVGSSMGGAFAIDYALEHPEQVSGLLLVAPGLSGGFEPPFSPEEQTALDYDDEKSQKVAQAWAKGDAPGAFEQLRALWCSALEGANLARFRQMVDQNLAEVFDDRSAKLATRRTPAEGRLSAIRAPTTLLIGDRDNPSSDCFVKRIARALPGARRVPVPGADHLINLSAPKAFDETLRTSLRGVA